MTYFDLSQPIDGNLPVYPGDEPVRLERLCWHPRHPYQVTGLHFGSHTGTHLDVPRHFLPQGPAIDDLPLERFCGPATVVGLAWQPGRPLNLRQGDWLAWQPGDALLLSTGWEARSGQPSFFSEVPIFASGTARWLLDHGIRLLGVDLPTVEEDSSLGGDWRRMHQELLAAGTVIVEGLVHLLPLVGRRVEFFAMPLSIRDGDGSPVRAFARDLAPGCQPPPASHHG